MKRTNIEIFLFFIVVAAIGTENPVLCKQSDETKKTTERIEVIYDMITYGEIEIEIVEWSDVVRGVWVAGQAQTRFDFIDKSSKDTLTEVPYLSVEVLEYGMHGLTIVHTATNVIELLSAMSEDYSDILEKMDSIPMLEEAIEQINEALLMDDDILSRNEKEDLVQLRQKCTQFLDQQKRYQSVPEKSIPKAASLAAATYGGYVAGSACAAVGAKVGTAIGQFFGPVYAPLFTISGALIGAYKCGMLGAQVGGQVGEKLANAGVEAFAGRKVDFTVKVK